LHHQCQHCAVPMIDAGICPECQKRPPNFRCCIAALRYQNPINAAVIRIKNDALAPELKQLSWLLTETIVQRYQELTLPTILIPMPLHWLKLLRRGFNQSQLIATTVQCKLTSTSVRADLCTRLHYGKPQHLQSRRHRQRSMSNAFTCRPIADLAGARVALVDDVVTTGATATAAADSLLQAGVKSVDLWCIARTGWHNGASSIKIPRNLNEI